MVKLNTEHKLAALVKPAQMETIKINRYGEPSPPSYGGSIHDALFNISEAPPRTASEQPPAAAAGRGRQG
jgi:hypothetical protein